MRKVCDDFVEMWERRCYQKGIPDEVPQEIFYRVPSYRLIAHAIMKNDVTLLGVVKKPCQAYVSIKRNELKARGTFDSQQLELF